MNAAPEVTSATVATGKGKPKPGQSLVFTASATDPDGDSLHYSWAFGDGASATGALVEHAYAAAGTYTAVVTVTDGVDSVSRSVVVTVKGKPASTGEGPDQQLGRERGGELEAGSVGDPERVAPRAARPGRNG